MAMGGRLRYSIYGNNLKNCFQNSLAAGRALAGDSGKPESVAASYATENLGDDCSQWLREAEAHLQARVAGAKFDFQAAAEEARRQIIERLLDDAEQELGSDSTIAERIAHILGDDGQNFVAVEAGDFVDEIGLTDLAKAAGAAIEAAYRQPDSNDLIPCPVASVPHGGYIRYLFNDGSAIVEQVGYAWDIEEKEPFSWSTA